MKLTGGIMEFSVINAEGDVETTYESISLEQALAKSKTYKEVNGEDHWLYLRDNSTGRRYPLTGRAVAASGEGKVK